MIELPCIPQNCSCIVVVYGTDCESHAMLHLAKRKQEVNFGKLKRISRLKGGQQKEEASLYESDFGMVQLWGLSYFFPSNNLSNERG